MAGSPTRSEMGGASKACAAAGSPGASEGTYPELAGTLG